MQLNSKIPEGPLAEKWSNHKFNMKLVNPPNLKARHHHIIHIEGINGLRIFEHHLTIFD